ncbi:double-strand break repair protein AddB [Alphaproteobacteria bacterium]|nr:double-strand break repair protein AddB [Alphaproteobacteria bacterium]
MTSPSVYSIDAGMPFARELAVGIVKLADSPERLARGLVLLPSRRAARALQAAFLDGVEGVPMLLPRMLPVGDFGNDDDGRLSPFLGDDASSDLPPPISKIRRQICLAKLVRHFPLGGQYPTQPQAMRLAESLGQLLDQLYNADATVGQLRDLLPDQFSAHWQDILTLLGILIDRWPDILAQEGLIDVVDRRNRLLRRRAKQWRDQPPDQLIVIAGSTGSIAATRELIGVVANLPDGHIVLPGLDRHAGDQWPAICKDSGHPQHQLAQLLVYLEITPDVVQDWTGSADQIPPELPARRDLMREVFRPAAISDGWQRLGDASPMIDRTALAGLKVVTARDRREEANLIALSLREALEKPNQTAAMITPDRQLAELVIADLRRWDIVIEDSAGKRLSLCPPGRFLSLLCDAVDANFAPLRLLSLLKHPYCAGGMNPIRFRQFVDQIELAVLRGPRPGDGLPAIAAALDDAELCHFFETHVITNLAALIDCWQVPNPTLASLADGIAEAAERLCATVMDSHGDGADRGAGAIELWKNADGMAASDLFRSLAADGRDSAIDAGDMPQILRQLLEDINVHPFGTPHPRLAILGAVEARMHLAHAVDAHRLILAGFNEGNWPPRPDIDPWMNSAMRAAVGLPPKNWRSGLSAHDVYMAICSKDIIVTRADKEAGTPTTKSRWLQRMEVVVNALGLDGDIDDGAIEKAWLVKFEPKTIPQPAVRPSPCPPLASRPRQFSATEIDIWITDPYAIYAKKILRLKPLDDIDRSADAALRGILFHNALADFSKANATGQLGEDALQQLLDFGKTHFAGQIGQPSIRHFWWTRFEAMAAWFIENEDRRRDDLQSIHAEISGMIFLQAAQGPVKLTARADRLEYDKDGEWTIVDYKTGTVPSGSLVKKGVRNQLAVEGLIAFDGGFESLPAGDVRSLEYWQLSGKKSAPGEIKTPFADLFDADEVRDRLERLANYFDQADTPYASELDPINVPPFKPYQHLSRSREWLYGDNADE